jgi:hypothetical protein
MTSDSVVSIQQFLDRTKNTFGSEYPIDLVPECHREAALIPYLDLKRDEMVLCCSKCEVPIIRIRLKESHIVWSNITGRIRI